MTPLERLRQLEVEEPEPRWVTLGAMAIIMILIIAACWAIS